MKNEFEKFENLKTYQRMLSAVGKLVEVEFDNGDALYGILDSFDYPRMLIIIRENIRNNEKNFHILNMRYCRRIRFTWRGV